MRDKTATSVEFASTMANTLARRGAALDDFGHGPLITVENPATSEARIPLDDRNPLKLRGLIVPNALAAGI